MTEFTTISSWALVIAKTLKDYGADVNATFEQAELNPASLHDANARYPYRNMCRLWDLVIEVTGDQCFGLNTVKHFHPTSLHALGFAWLASRTLKEALERTERYSRIVTSAAEVTFKETTEGYIFRMDVSDASSSRTARADAGMATVFHLCRLSYGDEFVPIRTEMKHPAPNCYQRFTEFYGSRVLFDSKYNQFLFDKHHIEKNLPTANVELARTSESIVRDYLAKMDRDDIVMQVKTKLTSNLSSGAITEKKMADLLHMSPRSLQRKLEAQQQTYRNLLDQTRQELALQYIQDTRLSIGEMTYLLGFSEASNFTRAFKRWTGQSPREYRKATAA